MSDPTIPKPHTLLWLWGLLLLISLGADSPQSPLEILKKPDSGYHEQLKAFKDLDHDPDNPEYIRVLESLILKWGYTQDVRIQAVQRLEARDLEAYKRTLRQTVPRVEVYSWLQWLCAHIADRGWVDLSPALVSSWSRPMSDMKDELKRPEYLALAKLHGQEKVTDVVFDLFMTATRPSDAGLRMRCWDLLHRLGQRERLLELLASAQSAPDDALLLDLRAAAQDLGIIPVRREEVLWIRKLREPHRARFWDRACAALKALPDLRRPEIELRDLGILVSANAHDPALLARTDTELFELLAADLKDEKHYLTASDTGGGGIGGRQRLNDVKSQLKWDDLLAMAAARRALAVPQVVAHLFDYADRDHADETTEYGGVIDLDEQGRFQVLEFLPKIREHDRKFVPTQEMLDSGYTAAFHFHFHVQRERNDDFAGPGLGDTLIAENLRMNCLVLTFINRDTLNVDYYRYGNVVVDLGVITRSDHQ